MQIFKKIYSLSRKAKLLIGAVILLMIAGILYVTGVFDKFTTNAASAMPNVSLTKEPLMTEMKPDDFIDSNNCGIETNSNGQKKFRLQNCTMSVATREYVGTIDGIDVSWFADENVARDPEDSIVISINNTDVMTLYNDAGELSDHPTIPGKQLYTNNINQKAIELFDTPYIGTTDEPVHIKITMKSSNSINGSHAGIHKFMIITNQ